MNDIKVGDIAPLFEELTQSGEKLSLESLRGRKVILYFYPKDNTPGCTAEACSLRDGYSELKNMGFEIVGVSPDSVASHQKFVDKKELPFTLIADTDKSVAEAYGVWQEKKLCGRTYMGVVRKTFIIDENGIVDKIIEKVKTKEHFEQIADLYK